jgi:hypothetical protein
MSLGGSSPHLRQQHYLQLLLLLLLLDPHPR